MSETKTLVAAAPVADQDRLKARCASLLDQLGGMEMPIDELRIREAGGCVCGMLVGMLVGNSLTVPAEEAAAVADLCAALVPLFDDADDRSILQAVQAHAIIARDSGATLEVTFG